MAIRVSTSEWREKRWLWHGSRLYRDMQQKFAIKERFSVTDVANLPALDHLADRTAYDVSTAICRELELKLKLKRQGRMLYLIKSN